VFNLYRRLIATYFSKWRQQLDQIRIMKNGRHRAIGMSRFNRMSAAYHHWNERYHYYQTLHQRAHQYWHQLCLKHMLHAWKYALITRRTAIAGARRRALGRWYEQFMTFHFFAFFIFVRPENATWFDTKATVHTSSKISRIASIS
jgi:hypothetical protein